ncbi:hypothetical protein HA402_001294 [Bradysia odoriphaga]|nr:hypothetical protein HA402_001294 [Bradysia odoriphaga]
MNITNIRENFSYISYCGISLSPQEATMIENSLIILKSNNKFTETYLWGRINGVKCDYYIAFGYHKNCLSGCKYFYSINCPGEWILMPEPVPDNNRLCLLNQNLFQGDVTAVEDIVMIRNCSDDIPKESFKLKEEDRLASTVRMIMSECAVVPRGALTLRPDGVITFSSFFQGLDHMEANDMGNYQLLRQPKATCAENLIKRPDYNYSTDTFDTIDSILPEGKSFTVNIDGDSGLSVVKSLYWPGMVFFHKPMTNAHGFCYVGNGLRNHDLLFML